MTLRITNRFDYFHFIKKYYKIKFLYQAFEVLRSIRALKMAV